MKLFYSLICAILATTALQADHKFKVINQSTDPLILKIEQPKSKPNIVTVKPGKTETKKLKDETSITAAKPDGSPVFEYQITTISGGEIQFSVNKSGQATKTEKTGF